MLNSFKSLSGKLRFGVVALGALGALAAGCNAGQEPERTGTVSMKLRTDVNGVGYRLRDGIFVVAGTDVVVSTETDPDAATIHQVLPTGSHEITLQPGWHLERQFAGTGFQTVNAELVSTNPQPFAITADQTTEVAYRFMTDGTLVDLGQGNLDLSIEVTDTSNPPAPICGNGAVETGESCDDGNASNVDSCSTSCTACAQVAGPDLGRPIVGWPGSGLLFTATANATLHSFAFHHQGLADQITLTTTSGQFIGSVTVPAGSPSPLTVEVTWPLDAGQSYFLLNFADNGFWQFAGFPVAAGAVQVNGTWGNGALHTDFWFNFSDLASCLR